ncbi:MAG: hypothetical protein K6B41_09815 [Butyrivibrio sp.]|nr:hypothetical protein [Butyrivibrio sp.]
MNYKKVVFPIAWEAIFILLSTYFKEYVVYEFFIFYLVLLIYFHKDFSMKKFASNFSRGKYFWPPLLFTLVTVVIVYETRKQLLTNVFWNLYIKNLSVQMSSVFEMVLYLLATIVLVPIVDELYFRKALICKKNVGLMILTTLLSLLLSSCIYGRSISGMIESVVMIIPLTLAYLFTDNIYIPMLVHLAFNIFDRIPSFVYAMARFSLR